VQALDPQQVLLERLDHAFRQHGDPVLVPFGVAHDDGAALEVNILDAQAEGLEQAQAGAVEELGDELIDAGELGDDAADLVFGEDGGQMLRLFGAQGLDGGIEFPAEHLAVEEEEGGEGLVLGGGGDMFLDGQVGEKGFDLLGAHLFGVALVVEEDEAADPVHIGFLGADGVVLAADDLAHDIEQLFLLRPGGGGFGQRIGRHDEKSLLIFSGMRLTMYLLSDGIADSSCPLFAC